MSEQSSTSQSRAGQWGPDFFIIGAMKAGTTSLHAYLDEHPAIYMSKRKDTNFFAGRDNWDRGFGWYRSLFSDRTKLTGESSAGYSMHPAYRGTSEVPRRIIEANPRAKVIYVLRDPIQRIVSHFAHNVASGREKRTIEAAFKKADRNHYVNASRYHFQISQYFECFDKSQTSLITSEALQTERAAVLRRVFEFLGVDAEFESELFAHELHRTSDLRQVTRLGWTVRNVPLVRKIAARLPITSRPMEKPEFSPALRRSLARFLEPDVAALKALTGERYDAWTTFHESLA